MQHIYGNSPIEYWEEQGVSHPSWLTDEGVLDEIPALTKP